MERKLNKSQFLQTNIESSVETIRLSAQNSLALRVTGQLLLGVAIVYSRKTKYLLDDCSETVSKIKLACRPGVMLDINTEKNQMANIATITISDQSNDSNGNSNFNSKELNNNFDILPPEQTITLDSLLNLVSTKNNKGMDYKNMSNVSIIPLYAKQNKKTDVFSLDLEDLSQSSKSNNFNLLNVSNPDLDIEIARNNNLINISNLNDTNLKRKRGALNMDIDMEDRHSIISDLSEISNHNKSLLAPAAEGDHSIHNINEQDDWGLDLGAGIVDDNRSISIEVGRDGVQQDRRLSELHNTNILDDLKSNSLNNSIINDGKSENNSYLSENGEVSLGDVLNEFNNDNDFLENGNNEEDNEENNTNKRRKRRHILFDKQIEIPVKKIQSSLNIREDILTTLHDQFIDYNKLDVTEMLNLGFGLDDITNLTNNNGNMSNNLNNKSDSNILRNIMGKSITLDMPYIVEKRLNQNNKNYQNNVLNQSFAIPSIDVSKINLNNNDKTIEEQEQEQELDQNDFDFGNILEGVHQDYNNEKEQNKENESFDLMSSIKGISKPLFKHIKDVETETNYSENTNNDIYYLEQTFEQINLNKNKRIEFDDLNNVHEKRSLAARTFFNVLQLATKNKISVKQDSPYGNILLTSCT